MTEAQTRILELMEKLSHAERREIIDLFIATDQVEETFFSRMTMEQRLHLDEGLSQAVRGDGEPASTVFQRLGRRLVRHER